MTTRIAVIVEGGIIQNVLADGAGARVVVVDHDTEGSKVGDHPSLVDVFGDVVSITEYGTELDARTIGNIYALAAYDPLHREPGDPLLEDCQHQQDEDCMNCRECGTCREDLDDDDLCSDCKSRR